MRLSVCYKATVPAVLPSHFQELLIARDFISILGHLFRLDR